LKNFPKINFFKSQRFAPNFTWKMCDFEVKEKKIKINIFVYDFDSEIFRFATTTTTEIKTIITTISALMIAAPMSGGNSIFSFWGISSGTCSGNFSPL